jgi:alginate O-acetyltransferase complex protein AlgJ
MNKIVLKLFWLALPFCALALITASLPLNFFSFRVWEALKVTSNSVLPGPFYPLQKIAMSEEGDLGHGTPYAIKKFAAWEIDRYGYRKSDSGAPFDVVAIGDSMLAGSDLTQTEIFSEVLQGKLGRSVYPYAPGDLGRFIHEPRFSTGAPKVVILERIERNILSNEQLHERVPAGYKERLRSVVNNYAMTYLDCILPAAIVLDRVQKNELLNYLRAKIQPAPRSQRYHDLFFYQGTAAVTTAADSEVQRTVQAISQYYEFFKKRNILFIYLPVPNKETIYSDFLPGSPRGTVLEKVLQGMKQTAVPTIDLLHAFQSAKHVGCNPYQIDDTHWNARGVEIAADLTAAVIQRQLQQQTPAPLHQASDRKQGKRH